MSSKGTKKYLKPALYVLGVIVIAFAVVTNIDWEDVKVKRLINKVENGSWNESKWAAEELGKMGEDAEAAIPVLARHMGYYLSTRGTEYYKPFREALVNIGEPAINYLMNYMNDPKAGDYEGMNFYGATLTLAEAGPEYMDFLADKLHNEKGEVSTLVLWGLQLKGVDNIEAHSKAKRVLLDILKIDASPHNRRFAIGALRRIGPDEEFIDGLCNALDIEDYPLREAAIYSLCRCGAPTRAVECLRKLLYEDDQLDENDHLVRWHVVSSLRYMGPEPEAVDLLIEAIVHEDSGVRRQAIQTLLHFDEVKPLVINTLIEVLEENEDPEIRENAVEGLHKIGPEPIVIDALIRALDDEDAIVRRRSIIALQDFGPVAEPALEKLRYLAENDLANEPGYLPNCEDALKAIESIEKAIDENRKGVAESE